MWMELTQNVLNIETIKELSVETEEDIRFVSDQVDLESYINNGIMIGNVSDGKTFSPKFEEILKVADGKRAVFYSNKLESGLNNFKKFLKHNDKQFLYLDKNMDDAEKTSMLEEFKTTTTFLLLHPMYTEGISIQGAEQLHILEPLTHLAKKEQLIARVIRYKSHEHLPANKRHVKVYQWACEMKTFLGMLKRKISSMNKWFEYDSDVFYRHKFNTYSQNISPDSIALEKGINLSRDEQVLSAVVNHYNEYSKKPTCCIDFPTVEQFDECMAKRGKKC
jgi:hypothetical protein